MFDLSTTFLFKLKVTTHTKSKNSNFYLLNKTPTIISKHMFILYFVSLKIFSFCGKDGGNSKSFLFPVVYSLGRISSVDI